MSYDGSSRGAVSMFDDEQVKGRVWLYQQSPYHQVQMIGDLAFVRFQASKHGFHAHEFGNLTEGCISTGAHFNPYGSTHGGLDTPTRHLGDFGNIEVDSSGGAHLDLTLPKNVSLLGDLSLVGRSLVIHEKEDDLGKGSDPESKITGNAGPPISCAIIGMADSKTAAMWCRRQHL
ncbi:Superoxide dismutase [Cu-Zn] [Thelohanellus kitauei]|uniref:Superoxide dismutase [Cu-Zn] n=1 Tax=Thelohanellus kitauei TaxID=669202 RepID=A0A0C2JFB8_THEKT|nr:Superoxide dismutase [Cu-Zn] [Thelohanellus kitauei]